ncbi:hypothetical protein AB0I81_44555 [Nonomuraea sp. NPDC050404]|uniref:hypothetical protein n=1 Tax=Nonomuraea sp. NPDC050404 TaxID=3155783 RepID=UPI0033C09D4F
MIREFGWFAYEPPQPDPLEVAVAMVARYAMDLLPVVLAFLALWAPRRLPKVGAAAAALALVCSALLLTTDWETDAWVIMSCHAVTVVALLRTRAEQGVPRQRAVVWSVVVLLAVGQTLVRTYAYDSGVLACWSQLKGTWALAAMHLDTAHFSSYWLSVAAIGAVLAGHRGAPFFGLVLLVPALFHPVAWYLSGSGHTCSSTLALFDWPFLIAGVLALLSHVRRIDQPVEPH